MDIIYGFRLENSSESKQAHYLTGTTHLDSFCNVCSDSKETSLLNFVRMCRLESLILVCMQLRYGERYFFVPQWIIFILITGVYLPASIHYRLTLISLFG